MSQWVILLLAVYVTLGLSRLEVEKATRLAVVITTAVVAAVLVATGSSA